MRLNSTWPNSGAYVIVTTGGSIHSVLVIFVNDTFSVCPWREGELIANVR